jgi:hypothetical protein
MLAKKRRGPGRPTKGALEVLSEALKEIEAYFEMVGFPQRKKEDLPQLPFGNGEPQNKEPLEEAPDESEAEEETEDGYGDGDDSSGSSVFDREEIEVAIDVFLSDLVKEGILPKYPRNKPPTLQGTFERIFGDDHVIIKTVQSFEEHIEGYFDVVGYDDMEIASNQLAEIRDMINKELRD